LRTGRASVSANSSQIAFPARPGRAGERADHLLGGTGAALLLQAGVIVDRDPGQLGDVLPAQAGGAHPAARGQARRGRIDPLPAAPQEVGQFREIDPVHLLILSPGPPP
jgi:hypothetical protein